MIDRVHVLDRPPSRVRARPARASTLDIPWLPVASLPYALLILLPLIGLTGHAIVTGGLVTALGQPLTIQSLRLSAETATLSTAVAFIIGSPVLVGGALITWARALGEFGATIMFAVNLPGRTETMPLAIYAEFERDLDSSIGLAIVLNLASAAVLVLFRSLTQQRLVEIQRTIVG